MEISCSRLRNSMLNFNVLTGDEALLKFLKLEEYTEMDIIEIVETLTAKLLEPDFTEPIAVCFPDILLIVVSIAMPLRDTSDWNIYLKRAIGFSKLVKYSPEVLRYSVSYFADKEAPFQKKGPNVTFKKIKAEEKSINSFDIVKCCYDLLHCNPTFYKHLWDWSQFVKLYCDTTDEIQKLYYNQVLSILFNMPQVELQELNKSVSASSIFRFMELINHRMERIPSHELIDCSDKIIVWNISSEDVVNIEGILLPIYNSKNALFYTKNQEARDKIVKVNSTKSNLKNIAMGLLSDKAIFLVGPVGCGKTTLVEYLAKKMGRIAPSKTEFNTYHESQKGLKTDQDLSVIKDLKRLSNEAEFQGIYENRNNEKENGFLRIQLGDQTDSKVLLGQYRCTNVPGEFIWLPGVLTQAVINGYWLLLEDLDFAPPDICPILSNLLENGYLSIPGFRDCLRVSPGFQLFITVRSNKSVNSTQKTIFSLLEKYFYTINIISLSRKELIQIVNANYPKLASISNRVVDIYLTFSSGDHISSKNDRDFDDEMDSVYDVLPTTYTNVIPTSGIINSGRLVSTRDLMKLCDRSYALYSVTSAECAYFIFQNAVDIFCSYLPESATKTALITSIGPKLGIIQSRCEYFSNKYKPDIEDSTNGIKIGRTYLKISISGRRKRYSDIYTNDSELASKKSKLGDKSFNTFIPKRTKTTTFSFTRLACCLLERIGICVNQGEPVLLVGETGVGKTSCVQYLAAKTNHKLTVVNMNNQSDVADLVGGFKPVDLGYVISPLRYEFELLFRKTFNESKNDKFLSNISACYNRGDFIVLVKLMLRITDTFFKRAPNGDMKITDFENLTQSWKTLRKKLVQLNSQLKKSANVSFAFITGSLVNCIKSGDWVLLDEINLASDETLECLSTILEPNGSIVLLEKGDLMPVKRHSEFRIFACMNPRTDVGKKDLPTGIRNRFTEFYVDELSAESDLRILIGDYLKDTGISGGKITAIVKMYMKLKLLSQLELNDGLGNRPVYSLRTLCRALTICAKNLCGSIDRNIYESFCLSFLTQLDNDCHKVVLELIKTSLLPNWKAILFQEMPKPGNNYVNLEGYWIEQGTKEVEECLEYILTETVRENLKDVARIISIGKLPTLLQGPTSAGKTSLIEYIAKRSGNHCLRINNHEHTDLQEYIGTYTSDSAGKLVFREGILVQAMRSGFWIILDELNLAPTDILEALNRVLDDNREIFIPETQVVVKAHPKFMLFATQNPPGLYGGRKTLSRAFKNRFIELHFTEIPKIELETILEKRCHIPSSYSQKMVKCMSDLQVNRKTTTKINFTLRDLFRWGNRYTYADKELLKNNLYDWNQHLVDEGYLVLSAKVRTEAEVQIIAETMFNNFRKKINVHNLFSWHENTSLATKKILETLLYHSEREDIVWTENMTRMAVLSAKALEFNEPVLLVGPTGCGKTTICQIIANIRKSNLRILNCHMHTEGADFLGGLRPCRNQEKIPCENTKPKGQLFEWVDGPLIHALQEGSFFMVDEISLAEDSVLERLNSVLEPSRTILLAEKGGALLTTSEEFVVRAAPGFQFLATMNPGADFGKKELSPALRNRFTEIWCEPSNAKNDLVRIASNTLKLGLPNNFSQYTLSVAEIIVEVVSFLKIKVDKFKFSVRDIIAWANYINENSKNTLMTLVQTILYGLNTVFLDSLEMIPYETVDAIESIRNEVIHFAKVQIQQCLGSPEELKEELQIPDIKDQDDFFGITPFLIEVNPNRLPERSDFQFDAPTTKKNLFRLLSALSIDKAILVEGPPGVGKTSIVENLAKAIGYQLVRINLCEHTDIAELFGTDLPAEESILNGNVSANLSDDCTKLGSFVWRDGPLLSALKSKRTWILLDELNLAPQSVLEGLNAILDHRGEVFISELNSTFYLRKETRIFACQNPLRLGGGRKGLPQSFLNRFTKVYLSKLNREDLLHVVCGKYNCIENDIKTFFSGFLKTIDFGSNNVNMFEVVKKTTDFKRTNLINNVELNIDLLPRMVKFSERLDSGLAKLEFGLRGGPFEINLRDLLRWCEFLFDPSSGFSHLTNHITFESSFQAFKQEFNTFLLILYERMKLVYYQRMRLDADRKFIRRVFGEIFDCDAEHLHALSEDVSLYWTNSELFLNDIVFKRDRNESNEDSSNAFTNGSKPGAILLTCQVEFLKNIVECVHLKKPVILVGSPSSGKTKLIDTFCSIENQSYDVEIIDDSVMGSFQQVDLNRHLEEISQSIESIYHEVMRRGFVGLTLTKNSADILRLTEIMKFWNEYSQLSSLNLSTQQTTAMSYEILLFINRKRKLSILMDKLSQLGLKNGRMEVLRQAKTILDSLETIIMATGSFNCGGHFEWVDSKIVKCLKVGGYISLEHVNLCSPAILDRLNPAFEPDGTLLLSEKGLSVDNENEVVHKHKNFRAFLTMDPKNGELSRAMRNRCIELDLSRNLYSQYDLQQIVFINGVTEMYLVQVVVRIHKLCIDIAESEYFNVSHLTHFAYLVACNKRAGLSDKKAVYNSAMDVYVYSSNVDILGHGLDFYQSKLRSAISEECLRILPKPDMCDFSKMILRPNEINQMSMIQTQLTPLVGLLKSYPDKVVMKETIESVCAFSTNIDLENPFESVKFYVFILYAMSTVGDATLRCEAIHAIVSDPAHEGLQTAERNELKSINKLFYKTINETAQLFKGYNDNLPWNSKLFPRIKKFKLHTCFRGTELCLNVKLLYNLLISSLNIENSTRLQKMSAISYSQAISTQRVSDGFNNVLLQELWPFLQNLSEFLNSTLRQATISIESYSNLILSLLWFNRIYNCSKSNVIVEKSLNMALIDKLLLHFKWTNKKLLRTFLKLWPDVKETEALKNILSKLEAYALTKSHPLNRMQKTFSKQLLGFVPYFTKSHIDVCILSSQIDEMTSLVPTFGTYDENQMKPNLRCACSVDSDVIKNLLSDSALNLLNYISDVQKCCLGDSANVPQDIIHKVNNYFEKITKNIDEIANIKGILQLLENINVAYNSADENPSDIYVLFNARIHVAPLREFFGKAALSASTLTSNIGVLNENYFSNMPTSSCHLRKLVKIANSRKYQDFKKMWLVVLSYISKISSTELGSLMAYISPSYYRNFSTFNRILLKMLQSYHLTSYSIRPDIFSLRRTQRELSAERSYCGPPLTNCIFNLLFEETGSLRQIELKDLVYWKNALNEIREIMWSNSSLITTINPPELCDTLSIIYHARKLLAELEYVENQPRGTSIECEIQYNYNFQGLTTKLMNCLDLFESLSTKDQHFQDVIQRQSYYLALIKSLVGAIELCIYVYVPEIDPVEKNRLKTYFENENVMLLKRILSLYNVMKAIMRYNGLANEELEQFEASLAESKARLEKLSIKTAVRPEICKYNELAESIKYFLSVNCNPEMLLGFINNAIECVESLSSGSQSKKADDHKISSFLTKSVETIKKMELWMVNSRRFILDIKKNFSAYYNDITEPLECSIIIVQSGFEGLKDILTQHRSSFVKISNIMCNINQNGNLCNILQETFEFPYMHHFTNTDKTTWKLEQMQRLIAFSTSDAAHRQSLHFKLLKASLQELKNRISVASNVNQESFVELESICGLFNMIWKDEEEKNCLKKVAEESLYVNKLYCESKSEDDMEFQEIQCYFPTSFQEDFTEFIMQPSLEKNVSLNSRQSNKNAKNLLDAQESKFIGQNFIHIMEKFSKVYYYTGKNNGCIREVDYINPFKMKLDVFLQLVNSFKTTLNGALDISMFNTYTFIVGLQQDLLHDLSIADDGASDYNFYKDSNINEIVACLDLLNQIVSRTKEHLALFPDHAVLEDIIRIAEKMQKFSATSPLARFNAGFQILRQKLSQWNDVAHKRNHLRDLEAIVAEYVQKWTKIELQFWRNCLINVFESVQSEAYKYWFFVYNLLHEYLRQKSTENHDVANIGEINEVICQFIENSNYADFSVRMRLLKSFEIYLHYVSADNATRKGDLITLLRNVQIYFDQFSHEIEDTIKSLRTPIEKKLCDFVKIESYNKDLSYFSMKNNINRVHRTLNKFLKEYKSLLENNISPVFKQKVSISQEYNFENEKGVNLRYEPKHKYYMLDSRNFVAPNKLREFCKNVLSSSNTNPSLIGKCDKLFTTSRIIVREIIENSQYSRLIHCLDTLLIDQIETCEYLRNLEVYRSQDKPKQKAQAKQILSQKKKGLIDLYKTLMNLGVNFKSGLKELCLNSQLTDMKIRPFCLKTMLASRGRKIDQILIYLNENLDLYYAKCIFKLKQLQNVMLTPNPELGAMNADRLKGFATDMFLLVQNQRKALSESVIELCDVRKKIVNITALAECLKVNCDFPYSLRFEQLDIEHRMLKNVLCEIRSVLEQYVLLLKCSPSTNSIDNTLLIESSEEFSTKNNKNHSELIVSIRRIISDVRKLMQILQADTEIEYLNAERLHDVQEQYQQIIVAIENLIDEINGFRNCYLPVTSPLTRLLLKLKATKLDYPTESRDSSSIAHVDIELENVMHALLISMQKVYKNQNHFEKTMEDSNKKEALNKDAKKYSMLENHLKEKIHKKMISDIANLRLADLNTKLHNIMLAIKYTGSNEEKICHANKIISLLPILEQYYLLGEYYLFLQLGAHKVSLKMLSVMLTVFVELGTKGFCVPPDIMQDDELGQEKKGDDRGEKFGLEDGKGDKDVSDKIETEDQLDDAKKPEDRKNEDKESDTNCKEENGIEMSDDFDASMQDVNKEDESSLDDDGEEEYDKQIGDIDSGAEKLDDQIWGSSDEQDEEEKEFSGDEGVDGKNEEEKHNDTGAETDGRNADNEKKESGLDAAEDKDQSNEKSKQNEIKSMNNLEQGDEEQANPYHNQLEEPVEPEEIDLKDCNLDEDNFKEEEKGSENPFEIDKMKDTTEIDNDVEHKDENECKEDLNTNDSDSDQDSECAPETSDGNDGEPNKMNETDNENEEEEEDNKSEGYVDKKETDKDMMNDNEEKSNVTTEEDYSESKDTSSKEDNIHSEDTKDNKGSNDQVANESEAQQSSTQNTQDTGEEKEHIGQAENDISEGHQGIADNKRTIPDEQATDNKSKEKRTGNVDEERILGDEYNKKVEQMKTCNKLDENNDEEEREDPHRSIEFQHVKKAKETDLTTLDNATEDQSKQYHIENEEENDTMDHSDITEIEDNKADETERDAVPEVNAENVEHNPKAQKDKSKSENTKEMCEVNEHVDAEGEIVDTFLVRREESTTAHCKNDLLCDVTPLEEPTTSESLEMRKLYREEVISKKQVLVESEDYEIWQKASNKMSLNAREFCEQLRLILEPTKCTRLKGDYRTGRRINMRKVIPYIASQFRKDKIWLRRTKPSQRDYKITIAIDDSKSMHHNNSKMLTLEAISLVSQALTLLESGNLCIASFGEVPQILLHHTDQFDGPKLVKCLQFDQNQTKIAELLDFIRSASSEEGSGSENKFFENLLLIISDGRNIFGEGERKVRNSVKLARLQRIFLIYVIIDNPENQHSILDIQVPQFSADLKSIKMKSYLDNFPFPFYVIVRDLNQLPFVLSEAMRQWFELISSEQ